MVKSSHECLLQSAANLVPISVVHACFFLISIERILATFYYKSYEKVRLIALTLFGVALTVGPLESFEDEKPFRIRQE